MSPQDRKKLLELGQGYFRGADNDDLRSFMDAVISAGERPKSANTKIGSGAPNYASFSAAFQVLGFHEPILVRQEGGRIIVDASPEVSPNEVMKVYAAARQSIRGKGRGISLKQLTLGLACLYLQPRYRELLETARKTDTGTPNTELDHGRRDQLKRMGFWRWCRLFWNNYCLWNEQLAYLYRGRKESCQEAVGRRVREAVTDEYDAYEERASGRFKRDGLRAMKAVRRIAG
ncbi:MAG: hypothetical protein ACR2HJ_06515 [Fimbriimonadales bacterium]